MLFMVFLESSTKSPPASAAVRARVAHRARVVRQQSRPPSPPGSFRRPRQGRPPSPPESSAKSPPESSAVPPGSFAESRPESSTKSPPGSSAKLCLESPPESSTKSSVVRPRVVRRALFGVPTRVVHQVPASRLPSRVVRRPRERANISCFCKQ